MLILVFLFNKTQTFSPEANKNGNENRAPEKNIDRLRMEHWFYFISAKKHTEHDGSMHTNESFILLCEQRVKHGEQKSWRWNEWLFQ